MKRFVARARCTLAIAFLAVAGVSGCATTDAATAAAASVATNEAATPEQRIHAGKTLYSARCQTCHALPEPRSLTPEAWPTEVRNMSRKSGLSIAQAEMIVDYLVGASRDARAHL